MQLTTTTTNLKKNKLLNHLMLKKPCLDGAI